MKYIAGLALAIALCAGVAIVVALIAWQMRKGDRREKIEMPNIKYGDDK